MAGATFSAAQQLQQGQHVSLRAWRTGPNERTWLPQQLGRKRLAVAFLPSPVFDEVLRRHVLLRDFVNVVGSPTGGFAEVEFTIDAATRAIRAYSNPGGGGGAPTGAEYLVGATHGSLSAERVVTDTATVAWDLGTAAQAKANVPDNGIADAKLRDSAALSVIGRSANSTGDPADIAAASDGEVLRRSGTSLGFGTVATAGIADDAVTYAKLQNVSATNRVLRKR